MDETTLTALQGSIKKWEAVVDGYGVDSGAENCPLCAEFYRDDDYNDDTDDYCDGCPVATRTKEPGCIGTPYFDWRKAVLDSGQDFPAKATTPKLVALAQTELDFLRSLIPPSGGRIE